MKAYNVKLEFSQISLAEEEQVIIKEYHERKITATELCEKLAQYGLQVVRISDNYMRLQMDVTNGKTEAILSFEVEL